MKKIISTSLLLLVIAIAGYIYINSSTINDEKELSVDPSDWSTYESEEFNFELKYPSDWSVAEEPGNQIAPQFNFYLEESTENPIETPFIHFSNVTNISVFPEGIGTEGLMGETRDLEGDWGDNIDMENSVVYVLENGTPFAAYIRFNNIPESWEDWGYAWIRIGSDNIESICFRDGVEVGPEEQCDPLGDESISIVHRGSVNQDFWPILKEAVRSISFESTQN